MVSRYGAIYSLSIIFSIFHIYFFCKKNKLDFNFYFNISLYTILISLITSRLFGFFWFKFISREDTNLYSFINSTGFFYGGFIGGLIFLITYCSIKNFSFFEISDIFSLPLSLSQGIGRIGCFYAGCCFGKSISLFEIFLNKLPVQIIESIFCFNLFLFLSKKSKNKLYNGQIFFI